MLCEKPGDSADGKCPKQKCHEHAHKSKGALSKHATTTHDKEEQAKYKKVKDQGERWSRAVKHKMKEEEKELKAAQAAGQQASTISIVLASILGAAVLIGCAFYASSGKQAKNKSGFPRTNDDLDPEAFDEAKQRRHENGNARGDRSRPARFIERETENNVEMVAMDNDLEEDDMFDLEDIEEDNVNNADGIDVSSI